MIVITVDKISFDMARIEKLSSTCKTSTSYALTVPCRQCAIFDRLGCRSPSDVRKILWTKSDETPQLTKFFCLRFKLTDSTMNPDVFFFTTNKHWGFLHLHGPTSLQSATWPTWHQLTPSEVGVFWVPKKDIRKKPKRWSSTRCRWGRRFQYHERSL